MEVREEYIWTSFLATDSGLKGYKSDRGEIKIAPKYQRAQEEFDGKLAFVMIEGSYGFIDRDGRLVISNHYDDVGMFSEGLARAKVDGKWGYIDLSGEVVEPFRWDAAKDVRNGRAEVGTETLLSRVKTTFADVNMSIRWTTIIPGEDEGG